MATTTTTTTGRRTIFDVSFDDLDNLLVAVGWRRFNHLPGPLRMCSCVLSDLLRCTVRIHQDVCPRNMADRNNCNCKI